MSGIGYNSNGYRYRVDLKYMDAATRMLDRLPERYPRYFVVVSGAKRDITQGATISGFPIGGYDSCVLVTPAKESLGFFFPIARCDGKITAMVVATDLDNVFDPDGYPSPEPELPVSQVMKIAHPTGLKKPVYRFGFI